MSGAPRVPDTIPPPTFKQKKFAEKVVETGTATEAYRAAYNAENMSVGAIQTEAKRTLRIPSVNAEIERLLSDNGVEITEILGLHARNMRQVEHLPTSQRAIESFEEMIGLKTVQKAPNVAIAFTINGSTEPSKE